MDFILNGQVHSTGGFNGSLANILIANNFSPHALRNFIGDDGGSYQTVETGKLDPTTGGPGLAVMRTNAAATLRRDEWIHFDQTVVKVGRQRLSAWADLVNAGLTYNVPNALGKMVVQHTVQGDIDPAIISMDGLRQSDRNRVLYDVKNLPLPLIHKDFSFSARELAASRNGNTPLDTTHVEMATRTGAGRAQVAGGLDRLVDEGKDLVIVSNAPAECSKCRPWEGRILSISGARTGERLSDGRRVVASVADARAAGLLHASCRHHLGAYIEGLTKPMTHTADPEGDRLRQEQRRLERGVRQWKRREAVAMSDGERAQARAKVREWQAALKQHVDDNGLKRLRYREQLRAPG